VRASRQVNELLRFVRKPPRPPISLRAAEEPQRYTDAEIQAAMDATV